MSQDPTPYDTGERLEAHLWVRDGVGTPPGGLPRRALRDDYGRVDFEDEEGKTVMTVYAERTEDSTYVLRVENLSAPVRVEVEALT